MKDASTLTPEQRAFYDHHVRSGSDFELIERRDTLRTALSKGHSLGDNRSAGLMALNELHDRINPQPTEADQEFQANTQVVNVAQRYFNQGNGHEAERILNSAGLTMDYLEPRPVNEDLDQRESECRVEYLDKRDKAISNLMLTRSFTKREATKLFDGGNALRGTSLDTELRRHTNRTYRFEADRPI
jgi:hypothetical protein